MPTILIYIIRYRGYASHKPYLREVGGFGPYHRCMFLLEIEENAIYYSR